MGENKKKKSSKKFKNGGKFFAVAVLLIVALFVGLYIYSTNSKANVEVETVMKGTAEHKVSVKGYIIREENVINAPESGILSFRANEGERVSKGSPVAVVYSGEVSDEVKSELSSIHRRISDTEGSVVEKNLFAGDGLSRNSQIKNNIDMIVNAVYDGDVSGVAQYKDDIVRVIRNDSDDKEAQTTLEKLQSRKAELENSISGSATTIYASEAGVMCSQIDGYEEYFAIGNLDSITPGYLKGVPDVDVDERDTVAKDEPCLKIINNYEWYYTAEVDAEWVTDLKVGYLVSLRFVDISNETMDGTIYSISEPADGKVSIVIKSRSLFTGMYTTREVKAEIIRKTYRGFKVSKDAVHIDKDGSYYVFVNSEGAARRRDVTILYSDDAYVIIKEDNSATNNLLLYDEVIISDTGVEEGETL